MNDEVCMSHLKAVVDAGLQAHWAFLWCNANPLLRAQVCPWPDSPLLSPCHGCPVLLTILVALWSFLKQQHAFILFKTSVCVRL